MRTLEIPNLPDELVQEIEKLARLRGKSVTEQAAQFLARGVAIDEEREAVLMEEIRVDQQAMADRGVFVTDDEIKKAKNWGRE